MSSGQEDEFDWTSANGDVLVPEQRSIAVYVNPFGQAVIREQAGFNDDEDTYICISHAYIPDVIAALRKIADVAPTREMPARAESEERAE